jgi:predicted GNAT family acetyltransferase
MGLEQVGDVIVDGQNQPILLNLDDNRFEIRVEGDLAFLLFRLRGTTLSIIHTEVPKGLQRQGLGDALARAALEYARGQSLSVKIICPFVAKFVTKHPEFQDLVTTGND